MKAPQSLPKPTNWQDFESLCKRLWGEIWQCPEIKKNGRTGQEQNGIDVYGIPINSKVYYGIQCKGKDEYVHAQLTEKEILNEIEKAKNFKPALAKMYFATTANKDSKIETFVREINVSNIDAGLFEVHLFSWEDIVDLIFENKETYSFYVNSNAFKTNQSVEVVFQNGLTHKTEKPKFQQNRYISKTKMSELEKEFEKIKPDWIDDIVKSHWITPNIFDATAGFHRKTGKDFNRSLIPFKIILSNTGSEPLEHWKLNITFPQECNGFTYKNHKDISSIIISGMNFSFDTHWNEEIHSIEIEPKNKVLVSDDNFPSDTFYLRFPVEHKTHNLTWKLLSKSFKAGGKLSIEVIPEITYERITVDNDSDLLKKDKYSIPFEDFIENVPN
ncbi:hypothetical protein [Nonlabens sp. SY33080]|uniref:hypothetical protein n=1 Tax=Nonlabens sp. SY33080 TaxID=2719911 RepID=UPI00142896C1|nr:hypothetical protein [Nonlabens sp. SY33080]